MSLDSLTPDEYQRVVLALNPKRNAIVKGVAGSGKSLILLKKAKQVAAMKTEISVIKVLDLEEFLAENEVDDESEFSIVSSYGKRCFAINGEPVAVVGKKLSLQNELQRVLDSAVFVQYQENDEIIWSMTAQNPQTKNISKSPSYAIVVYTKSLAQFFEDELNEIKDTGKRERGRIFYYYQWNKFIRKNPDCRFDYLFVDECQDYNAEDIENFRKHGKYCWFFGDTDQSIMVFPDHTVQSVNTTARQLGIRQPQDLGINHRLTIENAKIGEYILDNKLSFACVNHGPKPQLLFEENPLDTIVKFINAENPNIGILVYRNREVYLIKDFLEKKGIAFQWKTDDEMELDFKSTAPKILTWHCAKGLEFDNVFIPYCDDVPERAKSAFYVATTRARENLYLISEGNPTSFLPDRDSDVYQQSDKNNNNHNFSVMNSFDDDLPF